MKCGGPTRGAERKIGKLARSPKATLLITAFLVLSLHRVFQYFLSAVPLVPTLLNWGAILTVWWVLAMQIIECVGYLVEAASDLVIKLLRSIRRVTGYWRQGRLRRRAYAARGAHGRCAKGASSGEPMRKALGDSGGSSDKLARESR